MDGATDDPSDDWGPFGRPLFDDPSARALSRVGVIDVGSNSVRLVVFDGAARSPAYFYNEKVMAGLGAGLADTGRLNPEGRERAFAAIKRFCLLADGMGISPLTAVATAAMREAEDGPAFRREIEAATGLKIWVIDGEEEARLSAQGVLLGWPGAYGLVSDIGGSSMELAELKDGRVGRRVSSRLGPLRLKTISGGNKAIAKHIKTVMSDLKDRMGEQKDRLFLVGGSWRAIARIDMVRRSYPLTVLHEYRMTREDVQETLRFIAETDVDELRQITGIGETRMALVPLASEVLSAMLKAFDPHDIAVSSYGIREGMLYEQMPQRLRERDPLIEACRFYEQKDARLPGFGRRLYKFIEPLFPGAPYEELRLVRAACLLHDVSWRAHPDYRHEVTFEAATRANLGGVTHPERVFLGLSLLHRYKNSRAGVRHEELIDLLSEDEIRSAEILGKAMRFGAMLSAQSPDLMGRLDWDAGAGKLTMYLARGAEDLLGEVAEARFMSLASALGAEPEIVRPEGP
ncbi:Ppx/GppA family phosphatase [Ovoidimarina sediminis]|uniref:Ppx/GppA family phosphatase n=1 Tax=Ovoidimarina sediminis TaxID=3079856 RepID=UPI002908B094|nr:Ppx/GppA family phosphatase [Rhodophyticola sp. MJ-SS7]MDU8945358.1 Ppx/GppA family phosphatase [Rhodophyticola sp. MJ-SS7]